MMQRHPIIWWGIAVALWIIVWPQVGIAILVISLTVFFLLMIATLMIFGVTGLMKMLAVVLGVGYVAKKIGHGSASKEV